MAKTKNNSSTKKSVQISAVPMKPLADKVVVRPLSAEEMGSVSAFGIIIPDTSKEKPEQGKVVAVGPGKWNEDGDARMPVSVKVGDKVMFSKYGPQEIKINGVEYFIVSESDILAILS
jgi:chaperonin GroES